MSEFLPIPRCELLGMKENALRGYIKDCHDELARVSMALAESNKEYHLLEGRLTAELDRLQSALTALPAEDKPPRFTVEEFEWAIKLAIPTPFQDTAIDSFRLALKKLARDRAILTGAAEEGGGDLNG